VVKLLAIMVLSTAFETVAAPLVVLAAALGVEVMLVMLLFP
jgi:hypothetical protein